MKIENNQLILNDGTCYDLTKSNMKRVLQGLALQLELGDNLTQSEYVQCVKLVKTHFKGVGTRKPITQKEKIKQYCINNLIEYKPNSNGGINIYVLWDKSSTVEKYLKRIKAAYEWYAACNYDYKVFVYREKKK